MRNASTLERLIRLIAWALVVFLAVILVTSCAQTQERSVRVREGIEQGKPTRWVEREQSESRTQVVDPQAIGAAVGEAVRGAVPGADAIAAALKAIIPQPVSAPPKETDWAMLAAGLGSSAGAALTGYLALKKRQQLNKPKG